MRSAARNFFALSTLSTLYLQAFFINQVFLMFHIDFIYKKSQRKALNSGGTECSPLRITLQTRVKRREAGLSVVHEAL